MLTTSGGDGTLDCRPMAAHNRDFDGTLWFLTHVDSGKVAQIEQDARVSVTFADPSNGNYVAMKGYADIDEDGDKVEELWTPLARAWFPRGKDDPEIGLIKITVTEAQYWEASASKFEMGLRWLAAEWTDGAVETGETGKVLVTPGT
jgi:general stress protein 26